MHSFQFGNSPIAAPIKFPLGFLGICLKKKDMWAHAGIRV